MTMQILNSSRTAVLIHALVGGMKYRAASRAWPAFTDFVARDYPDIESTEQLLAAWDVFSRISKTKERS